MAIADVKEYTHLTAEEVEEIGRRLDELRARIEASRNAEDAAYIHRVIRVQRGLAFAGRVAMAVGAWAPKERKAVRRGAVVGGTALLGVAKILENMEIGHNVMHGQWDWMNDPEIHSSTWEWDTAQPAEQWKHSHNYVHHQFTNVLGYDNDIGYGILRMAREQKWHPANLGQPVYNSLLALLFEWGVALHDLDIERIRKLEKDPVEIIFCGHFPDGALHFTEEQVEDETRAEWYLRQMLGAANFDGGRLLHVLSGSLGFQIEHHLLPDLPSNRYPEIAVEVRKLCTEFGIPYTTGPLYRQYGQALRTITLLSLPNSMTQHASEKYGAVEPPTAEVTDRGRKSDDERPTRRTELGGWSRAGASARA